MSNISNLVEKNTRFAIKESISEIQDEARTKHRFKSRTGSLERAIQTRFYNMTGEVFLNTAIADYAPFVHQGTSPHKIFPKNKKSLRFTKGGKWIFAKHVNHPGTEKDAFLFDALKSKKSLINEIFKKYTGKMLKEVTALGENGGFSKTFTWK